MESPEEFTGSNDHTLIIKGKRTKRQRPSSPFGAAVTSSLSSGDGGGGHGGGYWSIPSPASSGEISTSTEEDEDMANCLILLAQGGVGSKQVEEAVAVAEEDFKIEKLSSSRRFAEMATTTAGKAGLYVYECKTCNRTFPSFQALGGHRASHKKPKTTVEEKISPLPMTAQPPDDDDDDEEEGQFAKISPPLSLPMATKPSQSHTNQKSKVHECSICGSEFSSGQALGGHMRRHRAAPNTRTATNIIDTSTVIMESHEKEENDNKPRKFLALDLNLPAPVEDDHHHHQVHRHRDTKFQFTTPNKQHLVFSAAALVDCHY